MLKKGNTMTPGKIILAAVLLCATIAAQAQTKKPLYPNLAGKWVSKKDPSNTLLVKNGRIYESHERTRQTDTFSYEITKRPCTTPKKTDKKSLFLVEKRQNKEYCYKLLTYSSNAFSMRTIPGDTVYTFIRYIKHV